MAMKDSQIQTLADDLMRNTQMFLGRTNTYAEQLKVLEIFERQLQDEIRVTKENVRIEEGDAKP